MNDQLAQLEVLPILRLFMLYKRSDLISKQGYSADEVYMVMGLLRYRAILTIRQQPPDRSNPTAV